MHTTSMGIDCSRPCRRVSSHDFDLHHVKQHENIVDGPSLVTTDRNTFGKDHVTQWASGDITSRKRGRRFNSIVHLSDFQEEKHKILTSTTSGCLFKCCRPKNAALVVNVELVRFTLRPCLHSRMPDGRVCPDQFRGYLWKWTNYIKGYQKRWFVLSNGLLSYYRSPAEMNHTCRGTINLAGAFIDTVDACSFVISNGGSQAYHLRAGSEVDRQRWVTALELAKAKAIRMLSSTDDDSDSEADRDDLNVKSLGSKLEDLITCNNLVNNHGAALQRSLGDVTERTGSSSNTATADGRENKLSKEKGEREIQDLSHKVKTLNEKAQLFRITSNAMISACTEFLDLAQAYEKKLQKLLSQERDKRFRLEETVETLAKQHNMLEKACEKETDMRVKTVSSNSTPVEKSTVSVKVGSTELINESEGEDDHDEFYDAISEYPEAFGLESPRIEHTEDMFCDLEDSISDTPSTTEPLARRLSAEKPVDSRSREDSSLRRSASEQLLESNKDLLSHRRCVSQDLRGKFGTVTAGNSLSPVVPTVVKYRKTIPERPNANINLWSIMKNCIGKELTKIPMPVNFNEPLSMTQRLTEELESSDLLDRAAVCENSLEQICYLAAFSVSCYASTADRTGKPFNPLLGETYEYDRTEDLGWRSLAEQVSHHPPSLAHHAEGRGWTLWQNFTMSSKFRGKYLLVTPLGTAHCRFTKSGNHYTWKKVTTTVNNIIVGRLWIDQSGEMDIINHTTGERCHLKYHAYSYFSKELPKRVTGYVSDAQKVTRYVLSGFWNQEFSCAKVVYKTPHPVPGSKAPQGTPTTKLGNPQTLPPTLLWKRVPLKDNASKMYNFSEFTCSLNQLEPNVAPTDSRLRPDEAAMEAGNFDEANQIKIFLEEAQRARRKKRENEAEATVKAGKVYEGYKPTWFEKTKDDYSDIDIFVYKGGYWEEKEKGDWSMCPKIYDINKD